MFNFLYKLIKSKFNLKNSIYKLNIAATRSCNSKCLTCYIWKDSDSPVPDLTLDDFISLFKKNKIFWVSLTGGEPFFREDLYEIANAAIKYSGTKILNIATNGILTTKITADTRNILLTHGSKLLKMAVTVSLDGTAEVNNHIKGAASFDQALKTFFALRELEQEFKNFKVYISTNISKYNIDNIPLFLAFCAKNNILTTDVHLTFTRLSSYYSNELATDLLSVNQEYNFKLNKIIDSFIQQKKHNVIDLFERIYLRLYKNYIETLKCPLNCKSGIASLFINNNGDILPCLYFNQKLGNIIDLNYNLEKLQDTKYFTEVRALISQKKCPNCWIACEAFQTILSNFRFY